MSDGPSGAGWDPSGDSAEHAKCVEAEGGDCVDLSFHGQLTVEDDA